MAEIICRHAQDDFCALMTAQGMEDASCYTFSITHIPTAQPIPHWVVWGRFHPAETTVAEIDKCIKKRLYPTSEENYDHE